MRFTFVAPGSRGDIQPYLALGLGLRAAGHSVNVVTTRDHDALVREAGLELFSVPLDVQAALQAPATSKALEGGGVISSFRALSQLASKAMRLSAEIGLEAGRGADAIITGFGGAFIAEGIAKRLSLPLIQAYNVPITPTSAFAGALVPGLDFGPISRRLGHRLTRQAVWLTARGSGDPARMEVLGMPSAPRFVSNRFAGLVEGPLLLGVSPAFLPPGPEWGAAVEVTGFWFVDDASTCVPPARLLEFLDEGPKPVCIGFGSMSHRDPERTTALVLDAVERAGVRAILLSGWGRLTAKDLPKNVVAIDGISHAWLYPRCAAVVHHGGAGTTSAALRAGVPAVVVPFHGDQPFWAQRVFRTGTGPAPIARRKLTAARLAAALREATTNTELISKAASLGAVIRSEDGVGRAVAAITRLLSAR